MSYNLKVVSRDREDARMQIVDYFTENLRHFPAHILARDAILFLFDSMPLFNVLGYEVEAHGGNQSDEVLVRIRMIKQTQRPLMP